MSRFVTFDMYRKTFFLYISYLMCIKPHDLLAYRISLWMDLICHRCHHRLTWIKTRPLGSFSLMIRVKGRKMHILTRTEAEKFCKDQQIPLGDNHLPSSRLAPEQGLDFYIPEDAGKRICLAKSVLRPFEGRKTLVWVDDWGVWPSGEHQHMFNRFRLSYGEMRPLIEAPVHIFEPAESEAALSVFCFCILFLWDCYVLSLETRDNVFISHDEIGWLEYEHKSDLEHIRDEVKVRAYPGAGSGESYEAE